MSFLAILGIVFALGVAFLTALIKVGKVWDIPTKPPKQPSKPSNPPTPPIFTPTESSPSKSSTTVAKEQPLLWDTPKQAYHSTRVMCDDAGLSYTQKNILCACVYQESGFLTNPKPNENKDPKTGKVWSTDYGIVQVNDYWHIGDGKTFPSVEYVLTHPDKCIAWMINIYRTTGALQPWSSFVSGAYQQWLSPTSPMWALAK